MNNIIHNNIHLFYEEDLPAGHKERFIQKLDKRSKKNKRLKLIRYYSIAATLALFIVVTAIISIKTELNRTGKYLIAGNSPEMHETEIYYQSQIHEKTRILSQLKRIDPEMINADLKEIDASLKGINDDMKNNPDDERIVNAIISNYQAKIDMLDHLIEQTK
jgi:hypothetical protein